MPLEDAMRQRIDDILSSDDVVLFMKGTRDFPQCGFSAATAGILDRLVADYTTVNVLDDESIRQGIKDYTDWPTIPQLYVEKEFVGGADLVQEMFESGELHEVFGIRIPEASAPELTISDDAVGLIQNAMSQHPDQVLHLAVDARGNAQLMLGPEDESAIRTEASGLTVLMDALSASRANNLHIALEETPQGQNLSIRKAG